VGSKAGFRIIRVGFRVWVQDHSEPLAGLRLGVKSLLSHCFSRVAFQVPAWKGALELVTLQLNSGQSGNQY
jgi:hypothetical protein